MPFQFYISPVIQVERNLSALTDLQRKLINLAGLFENEHAAAHGHLLDAAREVNKASTYWANVKWITILQFRAKMQRHLHANSGSWPSMDIHGQTGG